MGITFSNINITVLLVILSSFLLFFSLAVYTPSEGTIREKYFNHINYKLKNAGVARDKHPSIHLFPHKPRVFQFKWKKYGPHPSEMDIKMLIPATTQEMFFKQQIKSFPILEKIRKTHQTK